MTNHNGAYWYYKVRGASALQACLSAPLAAGRRRLIPVQ